MKTPKGIPCSPIWTVVDKTQTATDWLRTTIQTTDQCTKHGLTDQYSHTDLTKHGWSETILPWTEQ